MTRRSIRAEFFTAVVNDRWTKPKTYTNRKLERLRQHFGARAVESLDACYLFITVEIAGRPQQHRFYIPPAPRDGHGPA